MGIDLYLSDIVEEVEGFKRLFAELLTADELDVDHVLFHMIILIILMKKLLLIWPRRVTFVLLARVPVCIKLNDMQVGNCRQLDRYPLMSIGGYHSCCFLLNILKTASA